MPSRLSVRCSTSLTTAPTTLHRYFCYFPWGLGAQCKPEGRELQVSLASWTQLSGAFLVGTAGGGALNLLLLEASVQPLEKAPIVCLEWISSHICCCLGCAEDAWSSLAYGPERNQLNQTAWPMAFSFPQLAFLVSTWWTVTGLAKSVRAIGVRTRDEARDFHK